MDINDCIKAGKIASNVRENIKNKNLVGLTTLDICEKVENDIKNQGGKCAFPVNVSINEIAAHYTAEPRDQKIISESDLVKIDLGVHINGNIADTAVTICYDYMDENLVKTAEIALKNAMSVIKIGTKISHVGKVIENTIKQLGYKPIINLSGHSLDRYAIHAGKSIPNIWTAESFSLSGNHMYACEPFVTTRNGLGFVKEGNIKNIFSLVSRKKTKDKEIDIFVEYIWKKFNMLPFALRWITIDWEEHDARRLLNISIKRKLIHEYPILLESNNQKVAQAEHTFIPISNGIIITTII